jgi:hypothetical protein
MKSCLRMPIDPQLLNFLCKHFKRDPKTAVFKADRKTYFGRTLLKLLNKERDDFPWEECDKIDKFTAFVRIQIPKRRLITDRKVYDLNELLYGYMIDVFTIIVLSNTDISMTDMKGILMDSYDLDDLMTDAALTKAVQRNKEHINHEVFQNIALHRKKRA